MKMKLQVLSETFSNNQVISFILCIFYFNTIFVICLITGFNDSNHSVLRRMNTCTTYISVRRKANGNHTAPARSASFHNDSFRPMAQQLQRQFTYLESHTEEQL